MMTLGEECCFCSSTGIYHSPWPSPALPKPCPPSFPLYLFSLIPPHLSTKQAIIDAATGHAVTFAELPSLASSVVRSLQALGIAKGDVVLFVAPNSLHLPVVFLGIMALGAILSPANFLNTRHELRAQVQDSNAVLIVTTQELQPKVEGLTARPPLLIEPLMAGLSCEPRHELTCMDDQIAPEDTAALMYSSGTTGRSKGVVLSHANLIAASSSLCHVWTVEGHGRAGDDVYLCVLQMSHMFGLVTFICAALGVSATVVVLPKFSVGDTIAAIERYGVTRLPAVPPVVIHLMKATDVARGHDLASLKEVICGGAPLRREYIEQFAKGFPHVTLSQCYGLTETGMVSVSDGLHGDFQASSGRLIASIEAKIVDVDTQKALSPNNCGELHIRGPSFMQGYLGNREATSLTIDGEGWLHTGDLCSIDTCGRLYVTDRIKELIKYKGYQVPPAELEEILITHREIEDIAVIPFPHAEAGEIPMACVVRKQGGQVSEQDIISFMEGKVAPYKKIRKVVFLACIPRSPSGKILRRELRALTAVDEPITVAELQTNGYINKHVEIGKM